MTDPSITNILHRGKRVLKEQGVKKLFSRTSKKAMRETIGTDRTHDFIHYVYRMRRDGLMSYATQRFETDMITISGKGSKAFFGFYDHNPFNPDGNKLLYHRTDHDLSPVKENWNIDLFYFDLNTFSNHKIGSSKAWNWQKGARLKWYPNKNDVVIYNDIIDGQPSCIKKNISTGKTLSSYDAPYYDITLSGKYFLSIDYFRLEKLHPDYGYVTSHKSDDLKKSPSNDGIYRVNTETSEKKLLISFSKLSKLTNSPDSAHDYVMNLMLSPSGERFCFLHRYYHKGQRHCKLFISSIDGDNIRLLQNEYEPSHPIWVSDDQLLCSVNKPNKTEYILYYLNSDQSHHVSMGGIKQDGHPNIHPQQNNIATIDTYPNQYGERVLSVVEIDGQVKNVLGRIYGPVRNGIKRDLHPRWSPCGKWICIDAPKPERDREIYLLRYNS